MRSAPCSFSSLGRVWVYALTLSSLLISCASGTSEIAKSANATAVHAQAILRESQDLAPYVGEEGVPHLQAIEQHAGVILTQADRIHLALPKVKDVTPWWATLLTDWARLLLLVGVVGLLFYLGLAPVIRRVFLWAGSYVTFLLPSTTRAEAELARTQIEESPTPATHSAVTLRRAKDPYFDAAYKALRRKQKKSATTPQESV